MVGKRCATSMARTIGVAAGSLLPAAAGAQPGPGPYADGPWGMHGMWGVWGLGMGLLMLVFWVIVIAALVYAIRWLTTQGRSPHRETPLDIVKRRYASGEITREQFEALKRDLT